VRGNLRGAVLVARQYREGECVQATDRREIDGLGRPQRDIGRDLRSKQQVRV
jgi:hypothetical protein